MTGRLYARIAVSIVGAALTGCGTPAGPDVPVATGSWGGVSIRLDVSATGATIEDLRLMRAHTNPNVQIKAAGGVRTLEKALEVYQAGCSRFGATATVTILVDWKAHLKQVDAAAERGA